MTIYLFSQNGKQRISEKKNQVEKKKHYFLFSFSERPRNFRLPTAISIHRCLMWVSEVTAVKIHQLMQIISRNTLGII